MILISNITQIEYNNCFYKFVKIKEIYLQHRVYFLLNQIYYIFTFSNLIDSVYCLLLNLCL